VVYFAGIDGARFKRPVVPGDQLILEAFIDRVKSGIYKYKTRASVDGQIAAEAELMCTMRKIT
jgi:3-hydroxyacyl-[acyl-carrier-protein] dehydratase